MDFEVAKALFGEWLPDLPDLDNPGMVEAENVLPVDGTYKSYKPLTSSASAAPVTDPLTAIHAENAGSTDLVIGSTTSLYVSNNNGATWTDRSAATYAAAAFWGYAQYDNLVLAANLGDRIQAHTIGATTAFTALSATAPYAQVVAKVGQFVVAGQLSSTAAASTADRPNVIQWSGIDDPDNWPTPGSSTATAVQSGEQELNSTFGKVHGIFGGDQFGIVLQETGITRITYIGGTIVFQFDELDAYRGIGAYFPNANIQVGGLVYFISSSGFFATDGVQVIPIGQGKVDRYFWSNVNSSLGYYRVTVGHDPRNKLIYWAYPLSSSLDGYPTRILIYNYVERRWSVASETELHALTTPPPSRVLTGLAAFNSSGSFATFTGTPGDATLTTSERENVLGGYSTVLGVKPLVTGTSPAVTVAVGTRNTQDPSASTFTSDRTATASTGFADFRSAARYHRARVTITGAFNQAIGVEYKGVTSGGR